MATEGNVLWKCGVCEDCFYDLQQFAAHKCLSQTGGTISISDECIKSIDENTFASAELVNTANDQVEQAITAIAALEEENSTETLEHEAMTPTYTVSGKRHKSKPTIISINNRYAGSETKFKKHQKGKRSLVWAYFTALDCKKAMCCICHKVIAYCGTPTNLVYHLNRFHPTESEVVKNKQAGRAKYQYLQNKIPKLAIQSASNFHSVQSVKSVNLISAINSNKKSIVDKILDLVVLDLLPASFVQGEGFKYFLQTFDPSCQIPDNKKIMKDLLPKRYYLESKKVKGELMSTETVHLSVEQWTGQNDDNFLTVTAHFLTDDFDLRCYILTTTCLGNQCDSHLVATSLLSCISDWKLTDSVECVVTERNDCLTDAVSASGKTSIVCLAHTLDGIIKETFACSDELKKLLDKCRSLVYFLKHNDAAKQKLIEIQTQDKEMQSLLRDHLEFSDSKTPSCPLKAKKDNPDYWITIFYMLQRIHTLRNVSAMIMNKIPSNIPAFTDKDWLAIEETVSLLKAFEVVTLELCSENFPSLSKVIPVLHGLLSLVTNCSSLTIGYVEKLRKSLLNQLQSKLGHVEENISLAVATVLDPRFKNIAFQSDEAVDSAVHDITTRGRKYNSVIPKSESQNSEMMDTSSASYTDSLWESFEKKATPKKEPSQTDDLIVVELKNFFDEPLLDRKKNPCIWWRDCGSSRFPILTEVAKSVLSIPATSVPPSRIFMVKEKLFFERRQDIKAKYIDQMLFLNRNIL